MTKVLLFFGLLVFLSFLTGFNAMAAQTPANAASAIKMNSSASGVTTSARQTRKYEDEDSFAALAGILFTTSSLLCMFYIVLRVIEAEDSRPSVQSGMFKKF